MIVYVYDLNLELIGIVAQFTSLIWAKRYALNGDCELYLPASEDAMKLLKKNRLLIREDDDMVCIIKKIEIDTDEENGDYLIVTGLDFKSVVDQRIVWGIKRNKGSVETFDRQLVSDALVISTDNYDRMINTPNGLPLLDLETAQGFTETSTEQVDHVNLGEKIREDCIRYGWGYRVRRDNDRLRFGFYKGQDRTAEMKFCREWGNLEATQYIDDISQKKNVAYVRGAIVGKHRARIAYGEAAGIDRNEVYVDSTSMAKTITWKELSAVYPVGTAGSYYGYLKYDKYRNVWTYNVFELPLVIKDENLARWIRSHVPDITGWTEESDGIHASLWYVQLASRVELDAPANARDPQPAPDAECEMSELLYMLYLSAAGADALASTDSISFSFSADPDRALKYKQDWNLGDIVQIENGYGITANARVTEVVESWDEQGYMLLPTFETLQVTEAGDEGEADIITENLIQIITEDGLDIITE